MWALETIKKLNAPGVKGIYDPALTLGLKKPRRRRKKKP